jgi:hypothetical protein
MIGGAAPIVSTIRPSLHLNVQTTAVFSTVYLERIDL